MKELKKIDIFSVAKLQAILMVVVGLVLGIFSAIFAIIFGTITESTRLIVSSKVIPMIFLLPIFYGILGFVMGAVGAFLYNLIARWVGGIKVEFSER